MAFVDLQASLPAQTAGGATSVTVLGAVPSGEGLASANIQKLSLTAPSTVTGVTTNTATINFRCWRAGALLTGTGITSGVVGSLALVSGTNLTADTETNVTPVQVPGPTQTSGTAPTVPINLLPGDVLDVQCVQGGTGLVLPAGIIAKAELA